jgi:hypothetical protein
VDLTEFRGRVCEALIEIREVCEANPAATQQALPPDLRELLSIVRTAASELILCSSVREAIDRLKRDPKELGAVEYVSSSGLSDDEIEAAMRLRIAHREIGNRRCHTARGCSVTLLPIVTLTGEPVEVAPRR